MRVVNMHTAREGGMHYGRMRSFNPSEMIEQSLWMSGPRCSTLAFHAYVRLLFLWMNRLSLMISTLFKRTETSNSERIQSLKFREGLPPSSREISIPS